MSSNIHLKNFVKKAALTRDSAINDSSIRDFLKTVLKESRGRNLVDVATDLNLALAIIENEIENDESNKAHSAL